MNVLFGKDFLGWLEEQFGAKARDRVCLLGFIILICLTIQLVWQDLVHPTVDFITTLLNCGPLGFAIAVVLSWGFFACLFLWLDERLRARRNMEQERVAAAAATTRLLHQQQEEIRQGEVLQTARDEKIALLEIRHEADQSTIALLREQLHQQQAEVQRRDASQTGVEKSIARLREQMIANNNKAKGGAKSRLKLVASQSRRGKG